MEVRCSNCATEYEFDDALVSARGTSVKCTNCGHQFRVHPTTASPTVAEKWVVRDAQKRETTFTSLRDLQQAIVKGQLSPTHHLSHGGQAFRPLEDIYELQTFFSAARQRPPNRPAPRTLLGVGRDGQPVRPPSTPPPRKRASDAPPPQERVTPVAGLPAVNAATALEALGPGSPRRGSFDAAARPGMVASPPMPPVQHAQAFDAAPYNPPVERASFATQTTSPPSNVVPLPWQNLQGLHADSDVDDLAPRRGAGSRWIIAIVVLGALGLVAGTVGRDYLLGFAAPKSVAPKVDERVPALIELARVALAKGDFESANAELAKASVLGENDPRVVAELARLAVARVEPFWTQQRLDAALAAARAAAPEKPPSRRKKPDAAELAAEALAVASAESDKALVEQGLRERLAKAKLAVADAVRRAPTSVDVVRSQVDLLRLDGNLSQARTMVNALSARASDPDNAYSLGALDLAEGPAGYPSAIERLRVAARSEEALGRARPLLIYALSTTDPAAASAELDKLSAVAPTHRSLPVLRALVELQKAKLAPPEPEPPVRKPPPPAPAAPAAPKAPSAESVAKGTLAKATEALETGDLDTAEGLYQAVLQRTPNSIPALSGLGDIARQRHANATAAAYYDQILKQDRHHVPTLMARGDMYWEGGNRILAVALYRRALGQVGSSDSMGKRALRRIEEFDRDVAAIDSPSDSKGSEPSTSTPGGEAPSGSESPAPPGSESPAPPAPEPSTPPEPTKPSVEEPFPPDDSEESPSPASPPKASSPSRKPAPGAPAEPGPGEAEPARPAEQP